MNSSPAAIVERLADRIDDRIESTNVNIEPGGDMLERPPKHDIFVILGVCDEHTGTYKKKRSVLEPITRYKKVSQLGSTEFPKTTVGSALNGMPDHASFKSLASVTPHRIFSC
jgi:hypothetical protein